MGDQSINQCVRQAGHLGQQSIATRGQGDVEVLGGTQPKGGCHRGHVDQLGGVQGFQIGQHCLTGQPLGLSSRQIISHHHLALFKQAGDQLLQLQ